MCNGKFAVNLALKVITCLVYLIVIATVESKPEKGFCTLPPSITRRTVAIWTPENPIQIRTSGLKRAEACEKSGAPLKINCGERVISIKHASYGVYSNVNTCGSSYDGRCNSDTSTKIMRDRCDGKKKCEVLASNKVFGDPCYGTEKYLTATWECKQPKSWQLPDAYNPLNGNTKNIGTSNQGVHHYNNVNGINKLREGDFIVILCDKEYKAFSCDNPDEKWSKFCKAQTDDLKVDQINFFVPHHMPLKTARTYCRSHKGTLATIRSKVDDLLAAKVMLMRKQGDQCAFIGFTDEVKSGLWRWMDGQTVTYTNWAYHRIERWDQPNEGFGYGEEDYTVMCRYPDKKNKNQFKWFKVGPPRRYFGSAVNFELPYSFCTTSAEFVGKKNDCKRPTRPCGGFYPKNSKNSIIKHGEFTRVKCKEGYRIKGSGKISCEDGETTPIPRCIKIRYAVYDADSARRIIIPFIPKIFLGEMKGKKDCVGSDDDDNTIKYVVFPN